MELPAGRRISAGSNFWIKLNSKVSVQGRRTTWHDSTNMPQTSGKSGSSLRFCSIYSRRLRGDRLPEKEIASSGRVDRCSHLIKKAPMLNDRGFSLCAITWCRGADSNRRHMDFQSIALPTELPRPDVAHSNSSYPHGGSGARESGTRPAQVIGPTATTRSSSIGVA